MNTKLDSKIDVLRVVRKGPAIKNAVDEAIDQCAEVFNLRDAIEEARIKAEQANDERTKKMYAQRGTCRNQ
jgi:predicted CoA-binding protein